MWCWVRHWTLLNLSFLPCKREYSILWCSGLTKYFGKYKAAPCGIVMGCTVTIRLCQVVTPFRSFLLQHSHSSVSLVNVITEHRSVQLLMNYYRSLWGSFSSFVVLHLTSLWSTAHTSQRQALLCTRHHASLWQVSSSRYRDKAARHLLKSTSVPAASAAPVPTPTYPWGSAWAPHPGGPPRNRAYFILHIWRPHPPAWPHSTAFGSGGFHLWRQRLSLTCYISRI